MGQSVTCGELVKKLGGELIGNPNLLIDSVASLDSSLKNSISFFNNSKYLDSLKNTSVAIVILAREDLIHHKGPAIITNNPYLYFAKVSRLLNPNKNFKKEIHKSANIHHTSKLGKDLYIGPNVVIEENVTLNDGVILHAGSVIEAGTIIGAYSIVHPHSVIKSNTIIGKNCILYAGSVIGSDGFGYAKDDNEWFAIPQIGLSLIHI